MIEEQSNLRSALQRFESRREALCAAAAIATVFVVLAGLPLLWGCAGVAAVALWAVLRPRDDAPPRTLGMLSLSPAPVAWASAGHPVWDQLLAGIPDAAVLLDRASRVLAANAAASALLPVSAGRHISLVSRAPELLAAVERARTSHQPQSFQVQLTVPVRRLLLGQATPIDGDAGSDDRNTQQLALILVLRDQTAEQQLSQLRADFVANASHELRTPLSSLKRLR